MLKSMIVTEIEVIEKKVGFVNLLDLSSLAYTIMGKTESEGFYKLFYRAAKEGWGIGQLCIEIQRTGKTMGKEEDGKMLAEQVRTKLEEKRV